MLRSMFKISALVAPAALLFACSSSSGTATTATTGTGGTSSSTGTNTTGTGGKTTGTGGSAGMACTDTADSTALAAHQATIGDDVSSCTLSNITSGATAIGMCVGAKDGLTSACAACFGTYGECGAADCLSECTTDAGSSAPACQTCIDTMCGPAFQQCSGISGSVPDAG